MGGSCGDEDGSSCVLRTGTEVKEDLDGSRSDEQNSNEDGSSCMLLRRGTEMRKDLDSRSSDEQNSNSLLRRGIKFSSVEEFLNFLDDEEVKDKLAEVHKPECGLCGKQYSTRINVKRHILTAHLSKDKLSEVHKSGWPGCGLCGKQYSTRNYVKRHILTAHFEEVDRENIGKFILPVQERNKLADAEVHKSGWPGCGLCGKKCHNISNVKRHILNAHMEEVDRENIRKFILPGQEFDCEQCSKKFSWKENLRKHLRVHQKGLR